MSITVRAADQRATRHDRGLLPALFGLIVLMFGVPSMLVFQPLGASATPAAMLGTVLFLVWVSIRLVGGRAPSGPWLRPLHLALLFFAVAALLSIWVANLRAPTVVEMRSSDRGVLLLLAWSGICLGVADGLNTRHDLDRFLRAVVLATAAIACVGMLQFFVGWDISSLKIPGLSPRSDLGLIQERSSFRRVTGTTSHPLEFGVVLATVLPLAVHYAISPGWRHRRDLVCLFLIAIAIPMAISRSATLGAAVAGIVLFAGWNAQQRRKALLVVPVFLVGLRLLIPGLLGTIKSLFVYASVDPSISGRTDDYAQAEQYFAQSPILGRGWGTFLPEVYPLLDNQYLGQVMETGLVGLAALLTLFIVGIFCARGARRRAPDEETRSLGQALVAAVAVPMVTFATFDGFGFSMIATLTFAILGAAACLWRLTVDQEGYTIHGRWAQLGPRRETVNSYSQRDGDAR